MQDVMSSASDQMLPIVIFFSFYLTPPYVVFTLVCLGQLRVLGFHECLPIRFMTKFPATIFEVFVLEKWV